MLSRVLTHFAGPSSWQGVGGATLFRLPRTESRRREAGSCLKTPLSLSAVPDPAAEQAQPGIEATGNVSVESPPFRVFSATKGEVGGTGVKESVWGRGQGAARKEPGRRSLVRAPEIVSRKPKKGGVGGSLLTLQDGAAEVLQAFSKNHFRITQNNISYLKSTRLSVIEY